MRLYIETLTRDLNISRTQLVSMIGMSERTLRSMEAGVLHPKMNKLFKLWEVVDYMKYRFHNWSKIYGTLVNGEVACDVGEDEEPYSISLIGYINAYPDEPMEALIPKIDEAIEDFNNYCLTFS